MAAPAEGAAPAQSAAAEAAGLQAGMPLTLAMEGEPTLLARQAAAAAPDWARRSGSVMGLIRPEHQAALAEATWQDQAVERAGRAVRTARLAHQAAAAAERGAGALEATAARTPLALALAAVAGG